jgi:hypothetical protein
MNSLPAETSLLAVACPRCHAAIAVPPVFFGQPAACPICAGGFLAPQQAAARRSAASMPLERQLFDTSEPPPQTIRHGGQEIELRRLTPEEKAVRRVRRNIITIGAGTAILFAIVLLATRGGGKPKRKKR